MWDSTDHMAANPSPSAPHPLQASEIRPSPVREDERPLTAAEAARLRGTLHAPVDTARRRARELVAAEAARVDGDAAATDDEGYFAELRRVRGDIAARVPPQ